MERCRIVALRRRRFGSSFSVMCCVGAAPRRSTRPSTEQGRRRGAKCGRVAAPQDKSCETLRLREREREREREGFQTQKIELGFADLGLGLILYRIGFASWAKASWAKLFGSKI